MIKWFRKKKKENVEKPVRMDFSGVDMKLTIRSICYFETMVGKGFLGDINEDDAIALVYAIMITNNPDLKLSFDGFKYLLEDERVVKWCVKVMEGIKKEVAQLQFKSRNHSEEEEDDEEEVKIFDIATFLIVEHKLDPEYVMDKMKMWEIPQFILECSKETEDRLTEKRLWTYLQMLPQIDGRKISSPEKLLPFPWDSKENRKDKELAKNAQKAINFLKKQQKNGEG